LLGTKRIGHGMALAKSPTLIDLVKKNSICLECCPVSNRILGYCSDLRCHPVRGLIAKGVKVSINPDDQGFFDA
jgi:adenosine deaminase CECR1